MRIAYLLSCHLDPQHIARLCLKLTHGDPDCGVFVHVDAKSAIMPALGALLAGAERVHVADHRIAVHWGGYTQVEASYALLRLSLRTGAYDRFVILQGADYPIRSAAEIRAALTAHPETEYIRGCDATIARSAYLAGHARYRMVFDRPSPLKRIVNKATRALDIRSYPAHLMVDGRRWHVFWGSARICFTRAMADLFLAYEHHPALVRRFRHGFVPEEMVFHTIAFNSGLRANLVDGGPVPEHPGLRLVDTLGICYFEYPDAVTVFVEADFERLRDVPHFFIRKLTSAASGGLMDRIDQMRARQPRLA